MPKLRLSMPKKEEDLQKVVEEVYQEHPEMMEEEHHHHHHDEELLMILQTLIDAVNHLTVHIASLDRRVEGLEKKLDGLIQQNTRILDAVAGERKE